jgi:hypothetical protein
MATFITTATRGLLLPVCLATTSLAWAQDKTPRAQTDWTNLNQLQPGEEIRLVEIDSTRHAGAFVAISETAISLREGAAELSVAQSQVQQVSVRKRGLRHPGAWMLGGAAVGTAAGVLLTVTVDRIYPGTSSAAGIIGGAVLGAVAALLLNVATISRFPTYKTIYRAGQTGAPAAASNALAERESLAK